jgi:catechol 2,3-dioxygenase-like lactoylglutathione lyase family enzyme
MIHHVGLEIAAGDLDACLAFWAVLGWERVAQPDGITDGAWVQQGGFQIHLQVREAPVIPTIGHPALVDADLDATAGRIAAAGYELLERTQYWGERRIFTRCPAGHRVELMSAPPA